MDAYSEFIHTLCADYKIHSSLTQEAKNNSNIRRGLRYDDGTGVIIGCTKVGNVSGYHMVDGEKEPIEGRLMYRGYDLKDLVNAYIREGRFGFSEVAYLLLFGNLPTKERYDMFTALLHHNTSLPDHFTEDMILKNPSRDIMNKLGRSVLCLYSCDDNPDDLSVENMMRQSIQLVARFPVIVAYAYVVKRHYFEDDSLYLHRPIQDLSIAENFLHMIRPDKNYTQEEARLLELLAQAENMTDLLQIEVHHPVLVIEEANLQQFLRQVLQILLRVLMRDTDQDQESLPDRPLYRPLNLDRGATYALY